MKTMVKVLLIGLVVVVALVAFLLLNDFDSPRLGQTLLAKIDAATGVNITAKSYRLNLLHGLVLDGVEATSETPSRRVTWCSTVWSSSIGSRHSLGHGRHRQGGLRTSDINDRRNSRNRSRPATRGIEAGALAARVVADAPPPASSPSPKRAGGCRWSCASSPSRMP